MARGAQWPEQGLEERGGVAHERLEQAAVGTLVGPEPGRGPRHRALQHHRGPVVQRMRERGRRVDELETVTCQRQGAQERRGERQRLHRGARVVHQPRQRQLGGAAASAERLRALQHTYGVARPRHDDRSRQPVGARPDDDRRLRQSRGRAAPGA